MARDYNELYVYVIGTEGGPCKVGYSVDTARRLKQIKRPRTQQIYVMGQFPVGQTKALTVERYAHWLLRDKQVSGEWFDVSAEEAKTAVLRAINEDVDPDYPLPRVDLLGRALGCGEVVATKYPKGTRERIRMILTEDEHQSEFIRQAVETELKRRERAKPSGV